MAKKFRKFSEEDNESSVWNDAKNYVGGKIHVWLIKIDYYEELATFGFKDIEGDILINNPNLQNTARLKAMKRLLHAIRTLIRNTKFAVGKTERAIFDEHKKRIGIIEKHIDKNLPSLRLEQKRGNKITELNINETLFEKMMDEIDKIIDDINVKLNKAGLIFSQFDELDIEKLKENLEKEFTQ